MCDVVERIVNKGINEGKADVIRKMLDAKALTAEQIASILKLPVEEVKEIAQKVPELA
jgi:predicted transposase YdaD